MTNPEAIQALLRLGTKYGESFSLADEVWACATEEFTGLDDPQAGLACGLLAGEIIQMFAPATKAAKLTKS